MDDNKDYIINFRVSRKTYEKIKEKAKENRESISNLARKAVEDSAEIISELSKEIFGKGEDKEKFGDIVSFHKAQFAQDMECVSCDKVIAKGSVGVVGENKTGKKYYFCTDCR